MDAHAGWRLDPKGKHRDRLAEPQAV